MRRKIILISLIQLLIFFVGCNRKQAEPTVKSEPAGDVPAWVKEMEAERARKYASLDDYTKAMVDCGHLRWVGADLARPSSISGLYEKPKDCPAPEDFE